MSPPFPVHPPLRAPGAKGAREVDIGTASDYIKLICDDSSTAGGTLAQVGAASLLEGRYMYPGLAWCHRDTMPRLPTLLMPAPAPARRPSCTLASPDCGAAGCSVRRADGRGLDGCRVFWHLHVCRQRQRGDLAGSNGGDQIG